MERIDPTLPDPCLEDDAPRRAGRFETLLVGLGVGILLGLAWGEAWDFMAGWLA